MLHDFNDSLKKFQEAMNDTIKVREERLSKTWSDMIFDYQKRHDNIVKELDVLRENEEKKYQARIVRIEQEKERWYGQYRKEMDLLEERHKEREQHLLADIERRERENLGDLELRGVSLQTQSSLLSKFDAIEILQRERAEKTRAAFQNSTQ
ncbi:hypothetical protein LSM04_001742 [Trypanosoma melophagium]|uniref:uncharacterized protein n=1 Tax=Trypanosoma melophagium TaxID=715481 RepID=UPI00351A89B0|nr:hypothetical protein LSM04_001742 [Trypanosoma melophagium]